MDTRSNILRWSAGPRLHALRHAALGQLVNHFQWILPNCGAKIQSAYAAYLHAPRSNVGIQINTHLRTALEVPLLVRSEYTMSRLDLSSCARLRDVLLRILILDCACVLQRHPSTTQKDFCCLAGDSPRTVVPLFTLLSTAADPHEDKASGLPSQFARNTLRPCVRLGFRLTPCVSRRTAHVVLATVSPPQLIDLELLFPAALVSHECTGGCHPYAPLSVTLSPISTPRPPHPPEGCAGWRPILARRRQLPANPMPTPKPSCAWPAPR
ncbi:hypothetical protein K438DRAFT_1969580 [Mycena galopus ATCC 62051]|nr:hypothetical protein K438DRAFT_1969580 [Mycena galopus ATCC 62051]